MPIILARNDLKEILNMREVIDAVEMGFRHYKTSQCIVPVRSEMKVDNSQGIFLFMPAFMEKENAFGTKIVSVLREIEIGVYQRSRAFICLTIRQPVRFWPSWMEFT